MKKIVTVVFILILALSLSILAGCAKTEAPPEDKPAAKIADNATDAEGIYNGQIDGGSVEIIMSPEDTPTFDTVNVKDQIAALTKGDKVKFSYEVGTDGLLVLTKIEKIQ